MDIKFIIKEEINNSTLEKEIIEEGFKEWVVAGLMTLASLGGVKAQNVDNITQKLLSWFRINYRVVMTMF
jgi:predicted Zn-dependent peptidase